jgi:hypothetical protein
MALSVSRAALYAFGPFFGNPIKPALNYAFGDGYDKAYRHFRRDHNTTVNLLLHTWVMCFQMMANFALLAELDHKLEPYLAMAGGGPGLLRLNLTTITFFGWVFTLLATPTPFVASWMSKGAMAAAASLVHFFPAEVRTIQVVFIASFWGLLAATAGLKKTNALALVLTPLFAGLQYLPAATVAPYMVEGSQVSLVVGAIFGLLVAISALLRDPVKPVVIAGMVALNIAAVLCDEIALMYWACSYSAMVLQGASHDATLEAATLLTLNADATIGAAQKIGYEWSHVTYFPALLFHSVLDSILGKEVEPAAPETAERSKAE